jgi:hypothetical protein
MRVKGLDWRRMSTLMNYITTTKLYLLVPDAPSAWMQNVNGKGEATFALQALASVLSRRCSQGEG